GKIDTGSVRIFALNHLVVIVPHDNSAGITSLADLSKPKTKIILADRNVPAGQYAIRFLDRCEKSSGFEASFKQHVLMNVVSYEENVKVVLGKILLGEADAGIVYSSDISRDSLHRVRRVEIPDSLNVIAEYPIAIAQEARSPQAAREF